MSLANRKTKLLVAMLSLLLVIPMTNAFAMHIMEGYLPPNYCMYTVPYRRRYQYAKASKEE